jgi:hypothetical protein
MADLTEHDAAFLGGWPAIEWRQPITVRTMNGDNETGCHDVESAPSIWRRRTAMEHYAGGRMSLMTGLNISVQSSAASQTNGMS